VSRAQPSETPKTFKCPHCETEHKIPMYAYAHWNDVFTVTCESCNKQFRFFQGRTNLVRTRRRAEKGKVGR
jgi:transcription elongation factor Elf1